MLSANNLIRQSILVLSATAIAIFYFLNDPARLSVGFPCPFLKITGWQCWGCGGQRSLHHLLHGNLKEAFQLNALVFPVIALCMYFLYSEVTRSPDPYRLLRKNPVRISILVIAAAFTILRNVH